MTADLKRYQIRIEVPKGHRIKRGNDGKVEFISPFRCPFNYGSLVGIDGADGDLLDGILLGPHRRRDKKYDGYVVAVVRFKDKGVQDDKWILSETGQFSVRDYTQIKSFFRGYVILKNIQHTLMTGRLQNNSMLQQIDCMIKPSPLPQDTSMSAFQLRRRIKDFAKGLLGLEEADTTPPNWQSRAPSYTEPPKEAQPEARDKDVESAPAEDEVSVSEATQAPEAPQAEAESAEAPQAEDGTPISLEDVQEVLDDMVRPALQGDGGDITLIKIEDNNIFVQLVGACSSCPSSTMTMRMGVEALLREEFPAMKELIDVTNAEPSAAEA